jgi:hypothetical protein
MPAEACAQPGVDCPVQPIRLGLMLEQRSEEHNDRHAGGQ